VADEYKRNPITGELEPCTVPDTSVPPPTSTDRGVAILDPESGNYVAINDDNQMHVVLRGAVCPECSTSTPLGVGGVYTGAAVDILDFGIIFCTVYTDQDSAIGGLSLQLSSDGVNWDNSDDYSIYANTGKTYSIQPSTQYFRVVYTNGSTPQAEFRLQVIKKKTNSLPSSHRVGDDLSVEDDATLTKSVIVSEHADGSFKNVDVQHPLSVDSHVVFSKDLNLSVSNNYGFSGSVTDYFDSLTTVNNDASVTNPKQILLWFNDTIYTSAIGFGCDDLAKSFSNVKINFLGSGQVIRATFDDSLDNTTYNSRLVQFSPTAFNGILLEFHTTNEIGLSNITIRKELQTAAQLQAIKDDGTSVYIGATDSGNLKVSDAENGLSIAKGNVEGSTFIHKFGAAPDIDTADGFVDIWDGGGQAAALKTYTYSVTADIDSISSTNAGDTQDIEINGLDANYNLVTQIVTLTGQAVATLSTPLIRVFRMINRGSTNLAGVCYCYVTDTATGGIPDTITNTRAVMNDGNNQTLMALYTIPAGKTGYMRDWYASMANKTTAGSIIRVFARPFGEVFQLKHISAISSNGTAYIQHTYSEPEVFDEKTDIVIQADSTVNNLSVAAGFDIVLVDN
jgi:hypothetical protein